MMDKYKHISSRIIFTENVNDVQSFNIVEEISVPKDGSPGDLITMYYDVSIIADKDNRVHIIDNTVTNAVDSFDCNTLLWERKKIVIC